MRQIMQGLFNTTLRKAITSKDSIEKQVFSDGVGEWVHGMNTEELGELVVANEPLLSAYPQIGRPVFSNLFEKFNIEGAKDRQFAIHQIEEMRKQEGLSRGLRTALAVQSVKHNVLNIFGK